jgi:peptidoglycan hydrolase CwlO-like protein
MQDKILNRITELSSKINELLSRREELIKELHSMDKDISILYSTIHELKNLIEPETLNIDQSQEE